MKSVGKRVFALLRTLLVRIPAPKREQLLDRWTLFIKLVLHVIPILVVASGLNVLWLFVHDIFWAGTRISNVKSPDGVEFRIVVLGSAYVWKYGDATITVDQSDKEVVLGALLKEQGIAKTVEGSTDLIGVGLASCVGGPDEEEDRAYRRAKSLVVWLQGVRTATTQGIYLLNLGKNTNDGAQCYRGRFYEREQREVVIAAVVSKPPGADVAKSLRLALASGERTIFRYARLTDYSNWPEARFRLLSDIFTANDTVAGSESSRSD